jgi:F-type H+-transporting ATPase subunit b
VDFNLTLLGQSLAMFIFVWFCMKYIWPVITQAIETRQTEIADGLAAAARGRRDLSTAKEEADKLIAAARSQAREIVEQANTRASAIVSEGRASGETERRRQLEAAKAEIEVEQSRARDELRGQVAAIAVAGAEKILAREIDPAAHQALLNQLAREL